MKKRKNSLSKMTAGVLAGLTGLLAIPAEGLSLAVTAAEYTENGFGVDDSTVYQPATLNDNGTADDVMDDYYEIANAGQLYWFASLVNGTLTDTDQDKAANAVLTDDIVVNEGDIANYDGTSEVDWSIWTPIGNSKYQYAGIFDGQGKTISGLYVNDESQSDIGLFGYIGANAMVQNVNLSNSFLNAYGNVAGICGYSRGGTIQNCMNAGTITAVSESDLYGVGGICGHNENGIITDSDNAGMITGKSQVGGICGLNNKLVINCHNEGTVTATGKNTGGICGENYKTVVNSDNSGTIVGVTNVGGVCGFNGFDGEVANNYNTGAITATGEYVGGICGNSWNDITNCYNTGAIKGLDNVGGISGFIGYGALGNAIMRNCYSTATVSATAESPVIGSLCGLNGDTIKNSYYNNDVYENGKAIGENDSDATYDKATVLGKSTADFEDGTVAKLLQAESADDTYVGYEWVQEIGTDATPMLHTIPKMEDGYYLIETMNDLYWFSALVDGNLIGVPQNKVANAKLMADIEVNAGDVAGCDGVKEDSWLTWQPIALYQGIFDGQGFTVSGLYFNDSEDSSIGLFGSTTADAVIQNVGVENSYLNGGYCVGNICGKNSGTIINCFSDGTVTGVSNSFFGVGGICGRNEKGIISDCIYIGAVTGTKQVGGICGENDGKSFIMNSYNAGTVDGVSSVGGVCGENNEEIKNCFSIGAVSGTGGYIGGFCGKNWTTISNCFSTGNVTVVGDAVSDTGDFCGSDKNKKATNCYYLAEAETDEYDGTTFKTTAQFASGEVAYLLHQGCTIDETFYDGSIWGQNVLTEPKDEIPTLNTEMPAIYKVTFDFDDADFGEEMESIDTFTANDVDFTAIPNEEDFTLSFSVDGEEVSAPYSVSADTTILVKKEAVTTMTTAVTTTTTTTTETTATTASTTVSTGVSTATTPVTGTTVTTTITTETVMRGDANCDNEISIADAFETLMYNSKHSAGDNDYTFQNDADLEAEILNAVDIDADGEITIGDAYLILMYTSYHSAGQDITWEEMLG